MCAAKKRIELKINVLNLPEQRAHALVDLTPAELVAAILQEFREIEILDTEPAGYRLVRQADQRPLEDGTPLEAQVQEGDHLQLVETPTPIPKGALKSDAELYLRDLTTNRVFKLGWLPAVIGRDDPHLPQNQLVAVNLASFRTGLRVSRRHARVVQQDGEYFIEPLSGNPTAIRVGDNKQERLTPGRTPLGHGDTIVLERSEIALKFIVHGAGNNGVATPNLVADQP